MEALRKRIIYLKSFLRLALRIAGKSHRQDAALSDNAFFKAEK